jgi:hypothetical protein
VSSNVGEVFRITKDVFLINYSTTYKYLHNSYGSSCPTRLGGIKAETANRFMAPVWLFFIHRKYEGTSGLSKPGKKISASLTYLYRWTLPIIVAARSRTWLVLGHWYHGFEFGWEYGFMFVLLGACMCSDVVIYEYHTVYDVHFLPL